MSHGTVLRLGCVAASTPLITSSPPPLRAAPIFEFDSCPLRGMQGPAPLRRASPPSEAAPKPLCHCRPAAARMLRITSLFPDPPVRRKNTSSDAALWAARMLAISDKGHAGRPLVNPQACHETQLQSSFSDRSLLEDRGCFRPQVQGSASANGRKGCWRHYPDQGCRARCPCSHIAEDRGKQKTEGDRAARGATRNLQKTDGRGMAGSNPTRIHISGSSYNIQAPPGRCTPGAHCIDDAIGSLRAPPRQRLLPSHQALRHAGKTASVPKTPSKLQAEGRALAGDALAQLRGTA